MREKKISSASVCLDYILSGCINCVCRQVEIDRIIGNKTLDVSRGLVSDYGFEN